MANRSILVISEPVVTWEEEVVRKIVGSAALAIRLCSGHLALAPGHALNGRRGRSLDPAAWLYSSFREGEKDEPGCWNQVSYRAATDFASGPATSDR